MIRWSVPHDHVGVATIDRPERRNALNAELCDELRGHLEASRDLRAIIICPSNPFVSVEPILAVPGIRTAMQQSAAPVVAVTPIIGGRAIKGPAAKMMAELGLDVSGAAVARRYAGVIDGFVLDHRDPIPEPLPEVRFLTAETLMKNTDDRLRLGQFVLQAADGLDGATPVA